MYFSIVVFFASPMVYRWYEVYLLKPKQVLGADELSGVLWDSLALVSDARSKES